MTVAGLADKPKLSSEDIAFSLAPRLNAAGRLGQATLGVELLTTTSAERAKALAEYLHELNGSRESLERSVYLAARKQVDQQCDLAGDAALVLAGRGWHPGVIGIVAGRLAEKFHRPVVLDRLGRNGGQARRRLGPERGRLRSACRAGGLCRRFAQPWRPRDGGGLEDRPPTAWRRSARAFANMPPRRSGRGRASRTNCGSTPKCRSADCRWRPSRSWSIWRRSAMAIRARCCAPAA